MKLEKVKYLVGEYGLGDYEKGDIVDAFLLIDDGVRGLLLHPPYGEACASLELAELDGNLWLAWSDKTYLNISPDEYPTKDYETLLGILGRADR